MSGAAGGGVLYYAVGGGLGHLVRARAVLHTLGLTEDAAILTASPHADDRRVVGPVGVVRIPLDLERDRSAYRNWLTALLADLRPRRLIVDAFPAGVLGELAGLPALVHAGRIDHVARLLRWPAYARRLRSAPPRFATTHLLEPLHADHHAMLTAASDEVVPLTLVDPPADAGLPPVPGPFTLIAHSGPLAEVLTLVRRAQGLRRPDPLVVCSREPVAGHLTWLDHFPVRTLLPHARRLVTGAGFNCVREGRAFGGEHHVVPFARPLDDQPARAARYSPAGF
ncbi:MAG TPA: hypothetical protein VK279_04815 [Solirubrobacteraceae bacterium]|nr:hypothetical protein [Solirubrobacteraceae bacterium]